MKLPIAVIALFSGVAASRAADDPSCLASPTRACVLTLAVSAIEPLVAQTRPADQDRMLLIWTTDQQVLQSAANAGQFALATGLISKSDKSYAGVDAGPLFVAMKLAGKEKDLPPRMAENRSLDMYTGPALVANGRDADFAEFVKSRRLDGYDLAGMKIAGDLMAGKADKALAVLAPLTGDDKTNAVTRALESLLLVRRMDVSKPLLANLDLGTPDGVAACARIAEGTRDRAIAERCADALEGLPPKAKADYFGAGTVIPEVVGALATAGAWEQALDLIRAQPRESQKPAIVKLVKYGHSPELLPVARKVFVSGSAESGASLVRMLVMAGQPAEAASFLSTAKDDRIRDRWTNALAEALAESGDPAAALPRANEIADPVLRARALAAVADALKS
ncbi:MAG TPA: hypothetical protein VLI91_05170 [Roseiarcus sp.]|nr:hypothetical protein [Roseiarcus sp.]